MKFKIGQKVKVKSRQELINLGYAEDFPQIFDYADVTGVIRKIDVNMEDEMYYYYLDTIRPIIFIDADLDLIEGDL